MRGHRSVRALGLIVSLLCAGSPAAAQNAEDSWLKLPSRPQPSQQYRPASRDPSTSPAPAPAARAGRVPREVLALFDGSQETAADRTRIHRYLELPLNHLGQKVTYWDLRNGLPDTEIVKRHRAVVTWFGERISDPASYLEWAARHAGQGTRFVVLEFVGAPAGAEDLPRINGFLKHLGLEMLPRWVGPAEAGAIFDRDNGMVDFEHKLGAELPSYMVVETRGATAKSHLTLRSKDMRVAPQATSAAITTSAGGGLALVGYVRHYDARTNRLSWILNPFAFLQAALGLEQAPIPDTTTVAGRRLYFSHIDGDGWNTSGRSADRRETAAAVVLRELLAPYRDLPVSVGLIAGDVDPALGGIAEGARTARAIFALRHVEVASHTHTNPFRWMFYEAYDRNRELARVHVNRARLLAVERRGTGAIERLGVERYTTIVDRAFSVGGTTMPRARMAKAFDVDLEVKGALEVARSLAPSGKPVALYLWSGDTRPFEAAVRVARAAGVRNLNGGDARLDADFPSIKYLPPIARPVGEERQIYALNSNENTYTNNWRGPYDGQARLTETWDNTDAPRRLKGMNLYYHMYSGTRDDSLATVKALLERVRASQVHPVSASHYAEIADSFYDVEIAKAGPLRWRVTRRGALQTMRFDDAGSLYVDMRQSQGVLGFTHHAGALYVTLDEAVPDALIALTSSKPEPRRLERPLLVESRWTISKLKVGNCGFEADAKGYGAGQMTWIGVRPGRYTITALSERSDVEVVNEASVDGEGELKINLGADAIEGTHLKVACARGAPLRTGTVTR